MTKQSLQTLACVVSLFALNAILCHELFTVEYTQHMGSIEGAYISISRYALENPGGLSWFPLWYGGIPYQNSYPPLLHLLVAAFAGVTGLSAALSYHAITALMYCLGPVTLFWMSCRLSGTRATSFVASLLYSLFSPSTILMPSVLEDLGTSLGPRRLQALVYWGEGPHVMAMTLLPLAVVALSAALKKPSPVRVYVAAIALASVVLTNWLGGLALAAAVVAYLLSRYAGSLRMWAMAMGIGVLSYALVSPWIPPSTLLAIRRNAQVVEGTYPVTWSQIGYLLVALAALAIAGFLLRKAEARPVVQFSVFFLLLMAAQALSGEWFAIYIFPQPERYHLEMEMAICLVTAFACEKIVAGSSRRPRLAALFVGFCLVVAQWRNYRDYSTKLIQPVDIEATVEYQMADWLDKNLPGRRVFVPGSESFWLNAFADNPQLGGGFDQGISNPAIPMVTHGLLANEDAGELGTAWLRAYGVDAIAVGGANSREFFKPYNDPKKFDGVLEELWRNNDDVIYGVPRRSTSLAHVIQPADRVAEEPEDALDVEPFTAFVNALENPELPAAEFRWKSPHEAEITAELGPHQFIAVQVSHDPGWRAWVNGEPRRILRDELGLMAIDARCEGSCAVKLVYDGGPEMWLAKAAGITSILGGFIWLWVQRRFDTSRHKYRYLNLKMQGFIAPLEPR